MSSWNWGDVPTWVTAIAAVAAVIYGGMQVRQIRRQGDEARRLADAEAERYRRLSREGVAVSWRAPVVPAAPEPDGSGLWRYRFEVQNPGRLPITDVRVKIEFALDVQRLRYDGQVGRSTRILNLTTPVIVGGATRPWERTILMDFDAARTSLRHTRATVTFFDEDGAECQTTWPKHRAATANATGDE